VPRILLVSEWAPPDAGIARHSLHLANEWANDSFEIAVLAPKERKAIQQMDRGADFPVHRILGLRLTPEICHIIDGFKPDHVVIQYSFAALRGGSIGAIGVARYCRDLNIHVALACHEASRDTGRTGFAGRHLYRKMANLDLDCVAFVESEKEALVKLGFLNVRLVAHGSRRVPRATETEIVRARRGIDIGAPLVLAFGYLHPHKGFETYVDAANLVRSRGVVFLLAGGVRQRRGVFRWFGRVDNQYSQELESRISSLKSAVDFRRQGFVDEAEIHALLQSATMVVLPYLQISQSGVAAELLSNGCVVVASDLPGLHSVLGDAARYVPVGHAQELADAIDGLLQSPSEREELRQRARSRAAATSLAITAQEILSFSEE